MIRQAALLCTGLMAFATPVSSAPFTLDASHTSLIFEIDHLGVSTTIGQFREMSADLDIDIENPANSTATIRIDAASIDTNFVDRDDHLRGDEFFNVAAYPEIIYEVTRIDMSGEDAATVNGNLTMLGETRPFAMDAKLNYWGKHAFRDHQVIGFTATGEIDRTAWGLDAFAPVVGDMVKLVLNLEAVPTE